jgi:hypothetical protein
MSRLHELVDQLRGGHLDEATAYHYPPGEAKKLVAALRGLGMKVTEHNTDSKAKGWGEWTLKASNVSDSAFKEIANAVQKHAQKRHLKKRLLNKGEDVFDIAYTTPPADDVAQARVAAEKKIVLFSREPRPRDWTKVSVYVQSWGG